MTYAVPIEMYQNYSLDTLNGKVKLELMLP